MNKASESNNKFSTKSLFLAGVCVYLKISVCKWNAVTTFELFLTLKKLANSTTNNLMGNKDVCDISINEVMKHRFVTASEGLKTHMQ